MLAMLKLRIDNTTEEEIENCSREEKSIMLKRLEQFFVKLEPKL